LIRLRGLLASRAARVVGTLLAVGLVGLLLIRLTQLWNEHPVPLGDADWPLLVLALVFSGAAMTTYGAVWPTPVRALGGEPPAGLLAAFYAGQLAKYVPGGAWQYVGRAALAARLGVPLRLGAGSLALEAACSLAAAGLVAAFILATSPAGAAVAIAIAVLGLGAFLFAGRLPLVARVVADVAALRSALVRYLLAWVVFGAAFWLTAAGLYSVSVSQFPLYTGVFAAAWGAGFVVVFAPGGLGVREAVIVALLRGRLGESEAIVLAATSRIAFTLVDLAGGAAALAALPRTEPAQREKTRF
jgi:glycosyltransferase 2 family protein